MRTPHELQSSGTDPELGASLIIALVFISVFGLMLAALGSFTDTNNKATGAYRDQRSTNYAADAALDSAINRVQFAHDPVVGRDPDSYPNDPCNASLGQTILKRAGSGGTPSVVVSCVVVPKSGSGLPVDSGSKPKYALLTLGDRRTDVNSGKPTSIGVRDNEPPPSNGNVSTFSFFGGFGDPCTDNRTESGMRLNTTVYPWTLTFLGLPISASCAKEPHAFTWNVTGDVFSNSKIVVDDPTNCVALDNCPVPTQKTAPPPDNTTGTIQARGGCFGTGFGAPDTTCTDPGWNFSDGKGQDPGLDPTSGKVTDDFLPNPSSTAGDAGTVSLKAPVGLTAQSVPSASDCANTQHLVKFSPGIYTDATALNSLFGDASCKNATFWFQPGSYYFDFRNSTSSYQCGTDQSNGLYDPNVTQSTNHQWCIGGAGNDFGGQRVVGGTPYHWSPNVDPSGDSTTGVLTLSPMTAGAGPGTFFGLFPQPTQFTKGDNPPCVSADTISTCGTLIDGKTVNYAMSGSKSGTSIWLSSFKNNNAPVPRGAYGGITTNCPVGETICGLDLEIAQAAASPDRMNPPTVQVDYTAVGAFGLKTTKTCGPYTLPKPPADGSIQDVKLSAVNPAAAQDLSVCLNTGDKINSAAVRYNANRPGFQGSPYAISKLDGVRILVTTNGAPTFPRPPSETDSGGDCDPDAQGVQFIFGGDSRVYVPNGGLELCAGPNPTKPTTGQQIAVYGVPATPRMVATGVTGGTNPGNAKLIGENPTILYSTLAASQAATMSYPGFAIPSGYSISTSPGSVQMRTSFDAPAAATVALQSTGGTTFSGTGCSSSVQNASSGVTSNPVQTKTLDVTGCLTAASRISSAFNVKWTAGSGGGKLDGVEFIITLTPNDPNVNLRPENSCITASPNLWYGDGTPDCSVIRVDGPIDTSGNLLGGIFKGIERRGRLSVHGSIYAPSAAVDIDDEDVWYPLADRGIVARHLRLRGFEYHAGYDEPAFSNYVDTTPTARSVVFLACAKSSGACTPDDSTLVGRAAVSYAQTTNRPQIQAWSLGNL